MSYFIFRLSLFSFLVLTNLGIALFIAKFFIHDYARHLFSTYVWQCGIYLFWYFFYQLMTRRMVTTNEAMIIIRANFIAILALFAIVSILKTNDTLSRTILFIHFILNNFNPIWSYYLKKIAFSFQWLRRPIFAVCDHAGEKNINNWFQEGNPFGYDITDVLNVEKMSLPHFHETLETLLHEKRYDSVVIDLDNSTIFELNELVDHIQKNIHKVIILPKMSKIPMLNGELISSIHHKGMAFYIRNNLLSPVDTFVKKTFDLVMAIGLIILFSPLLIWLYGVVFVATKGHPFFRQERIGHNGKRFQIYKFRSMYNDAQERLEKLLASCEQSRNEWKKNHKLKDDPRITQIGHFLRKTSLDELPQLINVLKGEMSLVGPRPIVEDEIPKYGDYFDYFTAVKPGITGLWQVSGRNDIEYTERVQLDVWYVRNWSIELDLEILIKTFVVVVTKKGSY